MSETAAKREKKNDAGMLKLTLTLGAICAVCALLLGLVNMVTKDVIAANQMAEKMTAMQAVLPAANYSVAGYTGSDTNILSVYEAEGAGYVVEVNCAANSYSGTLSIMVGVDTAGSVTGVEILTSAETSGLGGEAKKPEWRAQFVGKSGTVAVDKDGGEIAALSGATFTSRGVAVGVNAALAAVAELG